MAIDIYSIIGIGIIGLVIYGLVKKFTGENPLAKLWKQEEYNKPTYGLEKIREFTKEELKNAFRIANKDKRDVYLNEYYIGKLEKYFRNGTNYFLLVRRNIFQKHYFIADKKYITFNNNCVKLNGSFSSLDKDVFFVGRASKEIIENINYKQAWEDILGRILTSSSRVIYLDTIFSKEIEKLKHLKEKEPEEETLSPE